MIRHIRRHLCLVLAAASAIALPLSANAKDSRYPGGLPDLRVAHGKRDIADAWFADPTRRYRHYVLGSRYEAGALKVRTRHGKILTYRLSKRSVFEDRQPRLVDLDGDGRDEIVVVRSYIDGGAALAVFGILHHRLTRLAETPHMGGPFQWLNPAGIADFNGDGVMDIAFVRKPHVLGRLELWSYRGKELRRIATIRDTSNHVGGSRHMKLSVVADFNGDGIPDLALPSMGKRALRFLTFRSGIKEISRKKLPAAAASDFKLVTRNGRPAVDVGLRGGRRVVVAP